MKIKYTGKNWYDNEYLSTYFVGVISREQCKKYNDLHYTNYVIDQNMGRLHHNIVKSFLKEEHRLLYDWLQECKISFGGYIASAPGAPARLCLLLRPDTPEELSFRLCYDIKVANE